MAQPTLHLLMGLPGSGKSTLAKILQEITGAARLSSDDYRLMVFPNPTFTQKEHDSLYNLLDHNVEHLLQASRSVIYDANLNRKQHRMEKYALAKKYKTEVILWCLLTSEELSKSRRISTQNHNLVPNNESPEKMFDRIASIYETPENNEKHIEINGKNLTKELVQEKLNHYLKQNN